MTSFVGNHKDEHAAGIPFSFTDYMALMDWTGRAIRDEASAPSSRPLPTIPVGNKMRRHSRASCPDIGAPGY